MRKKAGDWSFGTLALPMLLAAGCQAPLDSVQMILTRHEEAAERTTDEQRSLLMPCGAPVTTERADDLLPAGVLTIPDARSVALRANPDIHAAQARLEAARARIAEAQALFLPTVAFSHASARTFHTPASRNRLNVPVMQVAQSPPSDAEDRPTYALTTLLNALRRPLLGLDSAQGNSNPFSEHSTSLTTAWTVFDGFVRDANLLAARHLHAAAGDSLVDVERLIIQAVDNAYYQVQLAVEQIRIKQADADFGQEQLEETEKLRAAGRASQADVDNFRVRVLAARTGVTAAVGVRETGRLILAELMGLPGSTLPEELTLPPLGEETEQEMTLPQAEPWIEVAMRSRPDLRQLEAILRSEEENVRATKGLYSPTLGFTGSWGFDRSSNLAYSVDDQSSAAAIELRWEIYTGGARHAKVRIAESQRAEAAAALNRQRLSVQAAVRKAVLDLTNSQEQIHRQQESLKTARENRRIIQAGYLAGKETLTRLNETQRDFIEAEVNLALARIRLRLAWSDLYAASASYDEIRGEVLSGPPQGGVTGDITTSTGSPVTPSETTTPSTETSLKPPAENSTR